MNGEPPVHQLPPPPVMPEGWRAPGAAPPLNTLAVVSLISGIAGYVLPHPFIAGIVAIVTGHMARGQIRQTGESGAGMALAGLFLGYVHLALSIVLVVVLLLLFFGLWAAITSGATR